MAAMSTGTSFCDTFAVTTGAAPPSPPRPPPRPPRPPPARLAGPAADVLLEHDAPASARRFRVTISARVDTSTLQADREALYENYARKSPRIYGQRVI